ncbi:aldehyde dehydrogenase family protein [Verrucosispora sp. FIM060022]|nr:aldehyde dehydrogenase family protein [Verrucosispora sp. FIM060022]RUL92472.1 aldehyde dehydrogenase family protein [Verrucosispora sp. FIM060022]
MGMSQPPTHLLPEPALWIGEERVVDSSGGRTDHVYAATGQPTTQVVLAGPAEIDRAVTLARESLPRWRDSSAEVRRDALLRLADLLLVHAESLAALQSLEIGLPIQLARRLPALAADHLRYYAGWCDKIGGEVLPTWPGRSLDYTLDEPYGVVAGIIPWNGSLMSMAQLLGPALAAGNAVVVKPSELAPFVGPRFAELAVQAGVPQGVVVVVPGGPSAGAALAGHPGVDKVHFTGSGATGRQVLAEAARNLTPVALELGGKSPHLIFDDADLRSAARYAMSGVVALSGQGCANGTRLLVHSAVRDQVLQTLTARLRRVRVGDPADETTVMGPVVSGQACDRIIGVIDRARTAGAQLLVGGGRCGGDLADGFFVEPTVFVDADRDTELVQEEIFGPVLAVSSFDTEDEAVELANATRYGLGAYLHTNDLRRAHRISRAVAAGSVWVNGAPGLMPSAPFGGVKQSGSARIGGLAGLREFLRPKNVWIPV